MTAMTMTTIEDSVAAALAAALPGAYEARPAQNPALGVEYGDAAITAGFVGERSAELALAILDLAPLAAAAGDEGLPVTDLVRPALERAAAVLGPGVVGDVRAGSALFGHEAASVFELHTGGELAGYLAVRVKGTGTAALGDSELTGRFSRIRNVEMALTVEIGRTRMPVRDVLSLEPGSVVELDRSAGAPADILLNGRLIARGEVVVVDQDYAIRVTSILDVAEGVR